MEGLFLGHNTQATDDDVRRLLCLLRSKQVAITSCERFTTALNSQETVRVFVVKHSLDKVAYDLLCFATRCSDGLRESAVDWLVWRTSQITRAKTVRGPPCKEEEVEQSAKARRLEVKIQRAALADPGKTPNELALYAKPSVQSLKEKQDLERTEIARMCVKLFHRVGPVGKLYVELFGCLLYTSPSPRDMRRSRMPSSA